MRSAGLDAAGVTKPNLSPLTRCTAKPVYWHWVVEKQSAVFFAGHRTKRKRAASAQKTWTPSSMAFREGLFKSKQLTSFEVQVAGCIVSLWTFFWLAGGEVTGWCFKNIRRFLHHPSGSNQSGVYLLSAVVSTFHLCVCVWWEVGLSFCGTSQRYSSECCVYPPWGWTKTLFYCWIVVSAIITFLDWLAFLFHFLYTFTSLTVTCLFLLFGTQRRPRRLKLFLQTRMGDMKGFLYLGGPCRVLLSFTGTSQDQWRSDWLEPGSGCSVMKRKEPKLWSETNSNPSPNSEWL